MWRAEKICYCTPRGNSDLDLLRGRSNHLHNELTLTNVAVSDVVKFFFIRRPSVNDELVELDFPQESALDRYEISTDGYRNGDYARYLFFGSSGIEASSTDPRLRPMAFERPDGRVVLGVLKNTPSPSR